MKSIYLSAASLLLHFTTVKRVSKSFNNGNVWTALVIMNSASVAYFSFF
jgi:hypothetical protein